MLFCKAVFFFPLSFRSFPSDLHISQETYLPWRAPGWNFNERKNLLFPFCIRYLPPTPPPPQKKISQKSRCRSSLLINSSDGIGLGGLITFFCQHGGAVLQYLKPWDVKLLDANIHLSLSSSRFSSQGLVAAEDCLVLQEGKHSGGISLERWKQSGEEG